MSRLEEFYGAHDIEAMFPGGAPKVGAPWPRAARRKSQWPYDREAVAKLVHEPVRGPHELADVDPRTLKATQPHLTRAGVDYYMGPQFERTGETFADQGDAGNRWPVVYEREGENLLLSGHHRAAAALLQGRPLRARRISGGWGAQR